MNNGPDPRVDAPKFRLLCGVVKGKERLLPVPLVSPPDLGSSPRMWVMTHQDQGLG
jgi:hypothetical protein